MLTLCEPGTHRVRQLEQHLPQTRASKRTTCLFGRRIEIQEYGKTDPSSTEVMLRGAPSLPGCHQQKPLSSASARLRVSSCKFPDKPSSTHRGLLNEDARTALRQQRRAGQALIDLLWSGFDLETPNVTIFNLLELIKGTGASCSSSRPGCATRVTGA